MAYIATKTTKIDFRKDYCRCVLHKDIVERTTGKPISNALRRAVEEMLPMSEDICDICLEKGTVG